MREIVLDLLKKRQVSPCDQSPDSALNRETRPKSPADKKSSRPKRGVFFSGFASREWLFRTKVKVSLKGSYGKRVENLANLLRERVSSCSPQLACQAFSPSSPRSARQ